MLEHTLHLPDREISSERTEMGTNAAWLANDAFDLKAEAANHLSALSVASRALGAMTDQSEYETVKAREAVAKQDLRAYSEVVRLMIGPQIYGSDMLFATAHQ